MKFLSLFTGIGLHDLGLIWAGMEVVGQVEYEDYCTQILEARFPGVARWRDICAVTGRDIIARCGRPDLVTGGFPCTDISVAGKGAGLEGERSGLWFEYRRILEELQQLGMGANRVLVENVPALRSRGADRVLSDLEALGYSCWPMVVGAGHFAAPHRRQRVWIVAHSERNGWRSRRGIEGNEVGTWQRGSELDRSGGLADSGIIGCGPGAERAGAERVAGLQPQSGGSDNQSVAELDDTEPAILEGHRADAGQSEIPESWDNGTPRDSTRTRGWPAPPGPQHEWEAPRLAQPEVGSPTYGRSRRMVGSERRAALKALGNGNPPQAAYALGRAILKLAGEIQ